MARKNILRADRRLNLRYCSLATQVTQVRLGTKVKARGGGGGGNYNYIESLCDVLEYVGARGSSS